MVSAISLVVVTLFALASATNYPAGKRGIGTDNDIDTSGFEQGKILWQYNWGSDIYNNKVSLAEYVPMLWSGDDQLADWWNINVPKWLDRGSQHLLAFNEPEGIPGQANMNVVEAVDAWREHMEPYSGRARLGAPAVSNGGWDWITSFLNQCQGCHIDFIPIHWYNPHNMEWDFEDWVNRVCGLGKPVWVTEFRGDNANDDEKRDFLAKSMEFLENKDCVERYAYFGSADNDQSLIDGGKAVHLSGLGLLYSYG